MGACHHCERVGTCLFHGSDVIWIAMETARGGDVVYSVIYAVLFSKYVAIHGVMPHVYFQNKCSFGELPRVVPLVG